MNNEITINLLGFGVMAKQLVAVFALLGCKVNIWSRNPITLRDVNKQIKLQAKLLNLPCDNVGSIRFLDDLDDLEDNLTIEAISENIVAKKSLHEKISAKVTKGIYSNSSSYSPNEIGKTVGALHFFNPLAKIKLIEYFPAKDCNNEDLEKLLASLVALGFEIANVQSNRGFIANFLLFKDISNALSLVETMAYKPCEVNKIYKNLHNKDIFKTIDTIGVDITLSIIENLNEDDSVTYVPELLSKAIEEGILGKKNKTSFLSFIMNQ